MDAVDAVHYGDAVADGDLIGAYKIFESEDGKKVLKDLLVYCGWGAQDPTIMDESDAKSILAMQRIVWRIKGMLNAEVQEQGEVDE